MQTTISKPVKFKEGDGFLHGFSTGYVKVKKAYKTAKGGALSAKIHLLLGKEWEDFMPIMVWLIDHPEGKFLIDTGENATVLEEDYFKAEGFVTNYINTTLFKFQIQAEDEVGPQLAKLGYEVKDLSQVILTHLHLDHIDGLSYFEGTDILVHQLEWEKPSFALPTLYPKWFEPKPISLNEKDNPAFPLAKSLVQSGEIQLVHTPGHTVGHCSVLVKGSEMDYLLAGDATYDQAQLVEEVHSAGHQDFKLCTQTYTGIKAYASQNRLIYLPSHDPESLDRLAKDEYLK
ncbi:MAG: N-acyl homoserine lactonase family protein [Bacteroidota bacterium]